MSKPSTAVTLTFDDWNPSAIRYMPPKVNDKGGKAINVISTQIGRSLHVSTPLMMTWGISDFVDDKGESDGKFSMSLNFPNADYVTPASERFLEKMKAFENQILDDAVRNSEAWFGEETSREVLKHSFYPILKYQRDKNTKKVDMTKPPSLKAKVGNYSGKWSIEIYDTKSNLIFPSDNDMESPMDFVPKLSNVATVLQCGGIWLTGKSWGLTWKAVQLVVKPHQVVSVYGKCHIQLSNDELNMIEKPVPESTVESDEPVAEQTMSTEVDDSDEEQDQEQEPVVESKPVVKKVVKKAALVTEAATAVAAEIAPKKKVVKKAVAAV